MGNYKNEYKTLFDVEYDDRNNIIDKMEKEGWELDDESTYYSQFHDEVRVKLSFWKPIALTISTDTQEDLQDIMIHATRAGKVDRDWLLDTLTHKGLIGVFNLGLETMYRYLNDNKLN